MATKPQGHGGVVGPPTMARYIFVEPMDFADNDDAACRGRDIDFFPPMDDEALVTVARAVCLDCSIRVPCLSWAVANDQRYGIWGGKTPWERGAGRECRRCRDILPKANFYRDKRNRDGLRRDCKACHMRAVAESQAKKPEMYREMRLRACSRYYQKTRTR